MAMDPTLPTGARRSPSLTPPLNPVAFGEDFAPLPTLKASGNTDITFDGQLGRPLKLHEDVRTGCGGQTWPAGMVMGKHLLRYRRDELESARMYVSHHTTTFDPALITFSE